MRPRRPRGSGRDAAACTSSAFSRPVERVLPDRLEQREPVGTGALHEASSTSAPTVSTDRRQRLDGAEIEAAGRRRRGAREPLLGGPRAGRSSSRASPAASAGARAGRARRRQERRGAVEALQDRLEREQRACGQRRARSRAAVRRVACRSRRRAARVAVGAKRRVDRRGARATKSSTASASGERRHGVLVLAGEPQRRAARREHAQPGARLRAARATTVHLGATCSKLSMTSSDCARRCSATPRAIARLVDAERAGRSGGQMSSASTTAREVDENGAVAQLGPRATSAAASASRVLPVPPGPGERHEAHVVAAQQRRTAATSSRRPTSGVGGRQLAARGAAPARLRRGCRRGGGPRARARAAPGRDRRRARRARAARRCERRRARRAGGRLGRARASAARAGARDRDARRRTLELAGSSSSCCPSASSASVRSSIASSCSSSEPAPRRANGLVAQSRRAAAPRHSASAAASALGAQRRPRRRAPRVPARRDARSAARSSSPVVDADPVAGALRLDPLWAERPAQAVDVDLERRAADLGRMLAPERVDQPFARHEAPTLQKELRQKRALLRARRARPRVADREHLERPEQPER